MGTIRIILTISQVLAQTNCGAKLKVMTNAAAKMGFARRVDGVHMETSRSIKISASLQAELVVITGRNGAPRGRAERIGVMVYLAQDSRSTWSNVLKKVILVLEAGDHATENLWMQRRERHLCTPPWQ